MAVKKSEIELRLKIQDLMRALSLLRNRTPCGKPISVSMAHALMQLRSGSHGPSASQSTLQKTLQLDKSSIARLCMALEESEFILQRQCDQDGRSRLISLTRKGTRLADSLNSAIQDHFCEILIHIPQCQIEVVFESIELLTLAIKKANTNETRNLNKRKKNKK